MFGFFSTVTETRNQALIIVSRSFPGVMKHLSSACFVEGSGPKCEDRAEIFIREPVVVGVVADGAGGTAGGAAAANLVVEEVRLAFELGSNLLDSNVCKQLLLECAAKLEAEAIGQTTAVILATNRKEIAGASVGDSVAWLIGTEGWSDLTEGQPRKPLLGESRVNPLAITSKLSSGNALLLATDGLVKYVPPERIWAAVQRHLGVDETCAELVRLARLPNSSLQDDVGLVIMRM